MKRSIRVRLIVWILALLLPLSAGASWLLVQVFANRLLRDIDVALEEEAETVAAVVVKPSVDDSLPTLLAHIAAETDLGPGKFMVITRGGHVIAEAPHDAHLVLAAAAPPIRVASYRAGPSEDAITVAVGVRASAALHAKQRLTVLLAAGIPCLLLLTGAGLWVVTGHALRPLEEASRHLEAITGENVSARVPVENPHDEVGRMVTVLNRMLDRLQRSVIELQQFTADAAHELRTPLAVLRTGLEVAVGQEREAMEYRAALGEALTSTKRLCRLAEDLLTLARLDAGTEPRTAAPVELAEMLQDLVDAWTPASDQRSITVQVEVPLHLWVNGNMGDLYRLFSNLIDNAVRHAHEGGRVLVAAERVETSVHVTVVDDGPGLPTEELARVFDRFYRGGGVRSHAAGSGLGLSIAQEIARGHGGRITLANREGGGCVASVALPLAPPRRPRNFE